MTDYLVIDAHVHTYKTPEIGRQALSGFEAAGCCGTPEELVPILKEAGISLAVQVNMTPARTMLEAALAGLPEDQRESGRGPVIEKLTSRIKRRNEWTCQAAQKHARLVPFLSLDPIMGTEAMMDELVDKLDNFGARGLKIHPGEGRWYPDDPAMAPIYQAMEKRGLPVISHGGPDIANPGDYTQPPAFAPVLERFPRLTFVIAHLGGHFDESIELARKYPNAFFDTSAVIPNMEGHSRLSDDEAVKVIREIGVERVMFGSDYPWYHPARDLEKFLGLDFTEDEKKALLAENAQRILKLKA